MTSVPPETGHPRRWYVLGVLVLSLLAVVLDNTILNVALKTIADPRAGLGATQAELEWSINSYTLVFAGLLFTFGVIGDRLGRRRLLMAGMAVFGLASLLSAYAQSPDQLIWARALMGLGGAAVMPQTLSIISNVFEPHERGKAIGIWAGAVGLAIAIGPITGGLLLEHFWWGSVFLVNVPVVLIGLVLIRTIVPESRSPLRGGLDPFGVLLSIVGLVALTYGIIEGGDTGDWASPLVLGPIVLGLAVLGLFAWWESRITHPAFDVRLFRDPRLSVAVAAIALVFFAMAGVVFFISFYLQSVRGFSPLESGALVLPVAIAQLLVSPRSAGLVKRFGPRAVGVTGLLLLTAALYSYRTIGVDSPIWLLEVTMFFQGAGMALVMPPATESIMSALPRERAGAGSAVQNVARQVAVALGVAVLGSVVAATYRDRMEPLLGGLPAALRDAAAGSIEGTHAVASRLGPGAGRILAEANAAFVDGVHITALVSGTIALLGMLVVWRWMPGRPTVDRTTPGPVRREEVSVGA
ncbi:MFS transporter [Bailinhaonella thermotolerans]|uniref:DHA2 family efflux MFS transporter permease subunit n=1 Tax=Bailinhaonella thermotolerans TaxID=1070861 RepID=A0A3A4ARS3_9ACTN|nr:MFS transporter [Bailinhaonella thermotolerans]RJL32558.1 DHA2 family efflux MFS transporter permease subunit [Bailinhaonella thermotolerans]